MQPIPLPSPIHYELLLQLLERQTLPAVSQNPALREQVNQLIISIRKAVTQQKQLEESCKLAQLEFEFRWSLNHRSLEQASSPDYLPLSQNPLV
jgi:hypothetical protein